MNTEKKDKLVRELMEKSGREMPFADFEDKLMEQIYNEAKTSRSFLKDIQLSWFFFVLGTFFGLILNIIISKMNQPIMGIPAQQFSLILQTLFVIFLLFQIDRFIGLQKKS
jgi:hypothetical protein